MPPRMYSVTRSILRGLGLVLFMLVGSKKYDEFLINITFDKYNCELLDVRVAGGQRSVACLMTVGVQ